MIISGPICIELVEPLHTCGTLISLAFSLIFFFSCFCLFVFCFLAAAKGVGSWDQPDVSEVREPLVEERRPQPHMRVLERERGATAP